MKTDPPKFGGFVSRMSVADRIANLPVISDIDEMLRDGVSCGDVAKFIQLGLEELLDIKMSTLGRKLALRRKEVLNAAPQVVFNERLAAIIPTKGRRVAVLSRNQYVTVNKALDRLIELEAIYLAQRDRLDTIIQKEIDLGFPFEMTDRTVLTAVKVLEEHGKQEKAILDRLGEGPSHEKLDIKGYSEETAKTLQKADSRRRVISIVERLKRVKGGKEIPELEASGE